MLVAGGVDVAKVSMEYSPYSGSSGSSIFVKPQKMAFLVPEVTKIKQSVSVKNEL